MYGVWFLVYLFYYDDKQRLVLKALDVKTGVIITMERENI